MNRMFNKSKRVKLENTDLDITSLLDILVILLVFLLKSYNASELKLNLADELTLPDSDSRLMNKMAPVIQITKNQDIYIDNKLIGTIKGSTNDISKLENELAIKKKEILKKKAELQLKSSKDSHLTINLVFDQELEYQTIQKIMNTSAIAGFNKYKLVVKGNY